MKAGFICSNYYGFFAFKNLLRHPDIETLYVIALNEKRFEKSGMRPYYYQGSRYYSYSFGLGIESYLTNDLNKDKQLIQSVKWRKADYVFAMGYPDILDSETLSIAARGCIGVHPSLLPEYRGGAPINWQLIDGSEKIGVTSFFFAESIDSGNIICQRVYDFPRCQNAANFLEDVYESATLDVLLETVEMLKKNDPGRPMNTSLGFYRKRRKPSDGLIDLNKKPSEIRDFVRAQCFPFPGAFFQYSRKLYIVTEAEIIAFDGQNRNNSKIIEVAPHHIDVACLGGIVRFKGVLYEDAQPNLTDSYDLTYCRF